MSWSSPAKGKKTKEAKERLSQEEYDALHREKQQETELDYAVANNQIAEENAYPEAPEKTKSSDKSKPKDKPKDKEKPTEILQN